MRARPPNHYATLNVSRDATPSEIREAFTLLAKASHPDTSGAGSTSRFESVMEAFDVLRDARARAAYDASLRGVTFRGGDEKYDAALRERAAAFRAYRGNGQGASASGDQPRYHRAIEFFMRPRRFLWVTVAAVPVAAGLAFWVVDAFAGDTIAEYETARRLQVRGAAAVRARAQAAERS